MKSRQTVGRNYELLKNQISSFFTFARQQTKSADLNYAIWLKLIIQWINFPCSSKNLQVDFSLVFNIFFVCCWIIPPTLNAVQPSSPRFSHEGACCFFFVCGRFTSLQLRAALLYRIQIPMGWIEYFAINYSEGFLMTSFLASWNMMMTRYVNKMICMGIFMLDYFVLFNSISSFFWPKEERISTKKS